MTRPHISTMLGPLALLVGFSLYWFSDTIADPDLWGHIRFGQDILETGSIVQIDRYSYRTGDQPWINHEWLSEVIFAVLYNRSGPAGLVVFKVLLSLLIFGLWYAHLGRCGLGPWCSVALLVLISIPFRMGLGTIRPQIFTYFFFFLELLILLKAGSGREYWLWVVPILLAVWVNLHGGVLAGAGLFLLWVTIRIVTAPRDESGWLASRLGLAVRLGLDRGRLRSRALAQPLRAGPRLFSCCGTATVPRPEIREWAPLSLVSLPGQLYLILLAIGIAGLAGSGRRRTPETIVIFSVGGRASLDRQSTLSPFCDDAGRPGEETISPTHGIAGDPPPGPKSVAAGGSQAFPCSPQWGWWRFPSRDSDAFASSPSISRSRHVQSRYSNRAASAVTWPSRSIGESTLSGISGRV